MKRQKKGQTPAPEGFTAEQGTPLWEYNHFRGPILTALLNDLVDLEASGVADEHCKLVRQTLGYFVNSTTCIPRGGFLSGPLMNQAEDFEKLYSDWNGVKGADDSACEQRRQLLKRLRKSRQSISNKIRKLQVEFFNDLDTALMVSTYRAVSEMITAAPTIFKNLAQSYAVFQRRSTSNETSD